MSARPSACGGRAAPRRRFKVSVTTEDGRRITYKALSGNSLAAFEMALEMHGVCRIVVSPMLRRMK